MRLNSSVQRNPSRTRSNQRRREAARKRPAGRQLLVEPLEDRHLLSFLAPVDYAVGTNPQAVAVGDFNGDTTLDLAVSNFSSNSVSVLLGNADGTFQAAQHFGTGIGPRSLAVGDFNADGNLDVVTANLGNYGVPASWDLSVLLGNGDGTLQAAQSIALPGVFPPGYTGSTPVPQRPLSVAVGDLNADGTLDLTATATATFLTGPYYYCGYYGCYPYYRPNTRGYANVLLGNGDGSFTAANANLLNVYGPTSSALADFNGDAKEDLVVTDGNGSSADVLLGNGDGTLQAPSRVGTGYSPSSVAVGDLNGDASLDLVTKNTFDLSVLLGQGDGTFQPPQSLPIGATPQSVAVGDINADGSLDLVAGSYLFQCTSYGYYGCYYGITTYSLNVLLGHGDGSFATPLATTLSHVAPLAVALADFNGDQLPDTAVANFYDASVSVLLNDGSWVAPPALSISDASVTEGHAGTVDAVFTVSLSFASSQTVTVDYATADGSAAAGSDYVATSGSLTFAPGETTMTIAVPVIGDGLGEGNETFFVNLSNVTGAVVTDSQAVGTIVDDEPRIGIDDVTVIEGNGGTTNADFTVSLSVASDQTVTVDYATADWYDAVAGIDYTAASGTLIFTPGQTSQTITVAVNGDGIDEYDESFVVNLSGATNADVADSQAVGTILDDDAPPSISINDVAASEGKHGTKAFVFTASLSAASGKWVTVDYATADGTATTANKDYLAAFSTLSFAPGETSKTITVWVKGDPRKEADETFFVNLSGASEATIADGQGIGTILNDDPHGKLKQTERNAQAPLPEQPSVLPSSRENMARAPTRRQAPAVSAGRLPSNLVDQALADFDPGPLDAELMDQLALAISGS